MSIWEKSWGLMNSYGFCCPTHSSCSPKHAPRLGEDRRRRVTEIYEEK